MLSLLSLSFSVFCCFPGDRQKQYLHVKREHRARGDGYARVDQRQLICINMSLDNAHHANEARVRWFAQNKANNRLRAMLCCVLRMTFLCVCVCVV